MRARAGLVWGCSPGPLVPRCHGRNADPVIVVTAAVRTPWGPDQSDQLDHHDQSDRFDQSDHLDHFDQVDQFDHFAQIDQFDQPDHPDHPDQPTHPCPIPRLRPKLD